MGFYVKSVDYVIRHRTPLRLRESFEGIRKIHWGYQCVEWVLFRKSSHILNTCGVRPVVSSHSMSFKDRCPDPSMYTVPAVPPGQVKVVQDDMIYCLLKEGISCKFDRPPRRIFVSTNTDHLESGLRLR